MNAPLPTAVLNVAQAQQQINQVWDNDLVQRLSDYIAVPAKSPMFDSDWVQHGYIESVVQSAANWVLAQKVMGLTLEIVRLPGRTPVLFLIWLRSVVLQQKKLFRQVQKAPQAKLS